MAIDEKIKEIAIKEYLYEKEKRAHKDINKGVSLAVLIMASIYGVLFAALAFRDYFAGRFADGVEIFGMGMTVSALFLLPACLITWIILRRRAAKDLAGAEDELRRTSYVIEDDSLVRKVEGDGRRTKRYALDKIGFVSKHGFTVTFDYGNEEVELLDFYEPPLFDALKK